MYIKEQLEMKYANNARHFKKGLPRSSESCGSSKKGSKVPPKSGREKFMVKFSQKIFRNTSSQ